ncbi:MAG: hypothetical protein Q6365_001715 [Candidatus Sigynarchaeota archaeon]
MDAGILGIFFSKDNTTEIDALRISIKTRQVEAHALKPMLCEAFFHVCKVEGKDAAAAKLATFLRIYKIIQDDLDEPTINLAGTLKCQHRDRLSYIDCMNIAFCLNYRYTLHTTEKLLKQILPETRKKLRIMSYKFLV